jgi:hypothetical protein
MILQQSYQLYAAVARSPNNTDRSALTHSFTRLSSREMMQIAIYSTVGAIYIY